MFHHGMTPAANLERPAVVEHRPRIALLGGKLGEACLAVEFGQGAREFAQLLLLAGDGRAELGEHLLLDGQRLLGRRNDAAFGLHQLLGGEAHRPGHGLAVAEGLREGVAQQGFGGTGRHLDIEAEDIVVADLERLGAGRLHVASL